MPFRLVILLGLIGVAVLATGCIIPPEKPKPPAPGERLAARKIPKKGVSPKDVWKKEIEKMGVEPLVLDPAWFLAFPDGRSPHELVEHFYHEYLQTDLYAKEKVADANLLAKWRGELTAWLEENSLEFMDEDKEKIEKWKEKQSPPWPAQAVPEE